MELIEEPLRSEPETSRERGVPLELVEEARNTAHRAQQRAWRCRKQVGMVINTINACKAVVAFVKYGLIRRSQTSVARTDRVGVEKVRTDGWLIC